MELIWVAILTVAITSSGFSRFGVTPGGGGIAPTTALGGILQVLTRKKGPLRVQEENLLRSPRKRGWSCFPLIAAAKTDG